MSASSGGELGRLRAALAERGTRLTTVEQELADLRVELDYFAAEYEARVGALQSRLAELEAQLAAAREARARGGAGGPAASQVYGHGYASVEEQYRRAWRQRPPEPEVRAPAPEPLGPADDAELRRLYRELARAYHPDLGRVDGPALARRTRIMAEINAAYAARDLASLRALAGLAAAAPAAEPEMSPAARLDWLKNEIARLDQRIAEREHERITLEQSPLMRLKVEAALARTRGRDLLAETARLIESKIREREIELRGLP